jgi:hypothetical protein
MPEQETIERARKDAREGKSASTQAGEFVRQEMHHIREGKHGARSTKQAIAIGLSEARRAGVKLPPPKTGNQATKRKASQDSAAGKTEKHHASTKRSRATSKALKREGHGAASTKALSRQAKSTAARRGAAARSASAKRAAKTRSRSS